MNRTKVRWGILSTARIGLARVIRPMQACASVEIAAIASRELSKAQAAATELGIPKAYGSYEELLADPDIDAIYNPLPNHLHVPWSIKAMEAGKHVLCEKPLGMNAGEIPEMIRVRDRTRTKAGEAFMVRSHPRWLRARELVREGRIGDLRAITASFTFSLSDKTNVRMIREIGGGALMDVGCYPITAARFFFDAEPLRVHGTVEREGGSGVDILGSGILEFPTGQCIFNFGFSTILTQKLTLMGSKGRMELPVPFTPPDSSPLPLIIEDGSDLFGAGAYREEIPACNQYSCQAEAFSRAILDDGPVPVTLENALGNMKVIDAIYRSAESTRAELP